MALLRQKCWHSLAKKRTFPHIFLLVKGHFPREEENLFRMIEHCLFMEVDVALWNRKIALWIQCGDDGVGNGGTLSLCKSLWHTSLFQNEKKRERQFYFTVHYDFLPLWRSGWWFLHPPQQRDGDLTKNWVSGKYWCNQCTWEETHFSFKRSIPGGSETTALPL